MIRHGLVPRTNCERTLNNNGRWKHDSIVTVYDNFNRDSVIPSNLCVENNTSRKCGSTLQKRCLNRREKVGGATQMLHRNIILMGR